MYKAIIFDLDHTLLDYDRSETDAMQLTIRQHGLEQEERWTWERFRETFGPINWMYWSERNERRLTIHQILEYSFRDTFIRLEHSDADPSALARTYWDHFCSLCHFEDGARELLGDLHGNRKLAVISNGIGEGQRRRTASGDILKLFDAFIVSDEVGYWKPDRNIFEIALSELGAHRSEVLYVGDSLKDDYAGARAADIDFCLYNRSGAALDEQVNPRYVVQRIGDIRSIALGGAITAP